MEEIDLVFVDSASAGALGEPGNRKFLIQGKKDDYVISVLVEKQQVELLSSQSLEFLDSIEKDYPEEKVPTPDEFDLAGEISPNEPLFRAGAMGLIFDPASKSITLELRENPIDESEVENLNDENEFVVRMTMTRSQLRAMAVKGNQAVLAGRELCPLCQNPMDTSGHFCPRLN